MTKLLIKFILILSLASGVAFGAAETCQIKIQNKIYLLNGWSNLSVPDIVTDSDCPMGAQKRFFDLLGNFNGKIRGGHMQWVLNEDQETTRINILNPEIFVFSLDNFLKEQFKLNEKWQWRDLALLNGKKVVAIGSDEIVSATCEQCQTTGEKNIQLTIVNTVTGNKQVIWMTGKLNAKINALISKTNLVAGQDNLNANLFEFKEIDDAHPEQFFVNRDLLSFYKLNRPVQTGSPLKTNDIVSLSLVRPGIPVQVQIIQDSFTLSNTAIPTRFGTFGETIPLKMEKGNKIIQGKVIDFNKVLVEL